VFTLDQRARDHRDVPRFMLMIKGEGWEDLDDTERSHAPSEGEPIETKYGTCLVTHVEPTPENPTYSAKIVCRLFG
jgi:hypothetical protein